MDNKYMEALDGIKSIPMISAMASHSDALSEELKVLEDACIKAMGYDKGNCSKKQYRKIKIKAYRQVIAMLDGIEWMDPMAKEIAKNAIASRLIFAEENRHD